MILKILSKTKGTIVSVVFPPEDGVKNIAEGGPMLSRGLKFDELDLPVMKNISELSTLLQNSSIKRGKASISLSPLKPKGAKEYLSRKK